MRGVYILRMARNTGQSTQAEFESIWQRLGKKAFCYRVPDAAEVKGRTGRIGFTRAAPSDYILVYDGSVEFAEVKSTFDDKRFSFHLLKKGQHAAARQVLRAGGEYVVFVQRLPDRTWFRIPYSQIEQVMKKGKASLTWLELDHYQWVPPR